MACTITSGRKVPCKAAFGGIKAVYFCNFKDATIVLDANTDLVTTITMASGTKFFQYDVKGNSSLETTITSSRDNGTTFYTQTLNLTLPYLDNLTKNQIQLLATGRPQMIVEDYYGNKYFCGYENGMDLTGGTIVTGAAAGDLSGFTLTMEGMEEFAPYFITPGESVFPADPSIVDAAQVDPNALAIPQP
tara:strand:+ start:1833 stop:2402 length:570 start_codon:yes stop_codon:yes gene_type:complete